MEGVTDDRRINDINMENNNADVNTENQDSSTTEKVVKNPHTTHSENTKVKCIADDMNVIKSTDLVEHQNRTTVNQSNLQLPDLKQSCEKTEKPTKVQTTSDIKECTSQSTKEQQTPLFKKRNPVDEHRHYRPRHEEESGNSESSPTKNLRKRKYRDEKKKESSSPARSSGNDDSSRPLEKRRRDRSGEGHESDRKPDRYEKCPASSSERESPSKDKKSSYRHKLSGHDKSKVHTGSIHGQSDRTSSCESPPKRDSDENNPNLKKSTKAEEKLKSQYHGSKSNDGYEASSSKSKSSSDYSSPIKSEKSHYSDKHNSEKRKRDKEPSEPPFPKSEKHTKFAESNSVKMRTGSDLGKSTKRDRSADKSETKHFPIFSQQHRSNRSERGKEIELKNQLIDEYLRNNQIAKTALANISDHVNIYDTTKDNFVFFFGKESPFSQFHPIHFVVNNRRYSCAEQFMMHQKAVTFHDRDNAEKIMAETKPLLMKRLGRKVQGFDPKVWGKKSIEVVEVGNIEKFEQNAHLEKQLIATYPKILAEASPRDKLWGIGRGAKSPEALSIATWRGQNLLGFTLMGVRRTLMIRKCLL